MRDREKDEQWIKEQTRQRSEDAVYITPNHYDGGYEVRAGSVDFFVDYESIDAGDTAIFAKYL